MSKLEAVSTLHWPKIYICHISRNSCGFELFACETNFKKKAQCEIEPQPKSYQYPVINYLGHPFSSLMVELSYQIQDLTDWS